MTKELEKQTSTMAIQEEEAETNLSAANYKIEMLQQRICELERNLEAYNVLETTNVSLRKRVDELVKELEVDGLAHAEEIHKMRKDMFNHKMALEQTFRKTVHELDAEYRRKAFEAMSEESKDALIANARLKEELYIQSNGVENLLQRFKSQGDQFHRLKVEHEILEKGSTERMKEIAYLKRQQHEYSTRLSEAQQVGEGD